MNLSRTLVARAGFLAGVMPALVACGEQAPEPTSPEAPPSPDDTPLAIAPSPSPEATPSGAPSLPAEAARPGTEVLVGAGDIAECEENGDEATARLLDEINGTIFVAGDAVYDDGTASEYAQCYLPSWGRHADRTRFPAPGNHDYHTDDAAGYLDYFDTAASPDGETWYSADLGAWHVIVLDSNCDDHGLCEEDSPQVKWLQADLAASEAACTIAIWHHPRFSDGSVHGGDRTLRPIWQALYDAGAEVVVSAHNHVYERFAPQDPSAEADLERGIRQFVVGTGGAELHGFDDDRAPNSEVRQNQAHGVLRLELRRDAYAWDFIAVEGQTFTDSGTGRCH